MRWSVLVLLTILSHSVLAADLRPAVGEPRAPVVGTFRALVYHEVRNDVRDYPDPYSVDEAALVAQFAWLRGSGYTVVSLEQIIAARQGGKLLPEKSVLLTFDDAYRSFYTRVYPVLREFGFPAVLAVVGSWIDAPPGGQILYGEKGSVSRADFPSWAELREMADSGLIEIASHTYDLHRGVLANPQGSMQPAATARIYSSATGTYETESSWRTRVSADLARNVRTIERETGHHPRITVWPYGSYNGELVRIASELGASVTLTLIDGVNSSEVPLIALRRTLVEHNPELADFVDEVLGPQNPIPLRAVRVSLDDVYSADPAEQERNLSALLDRIQVFKPSHIYLQAYAGNAENSAASAVYFPNRNLPLRADLFSRVAWQLMTRNEASVFALLPVNGFGLPKERLVEVYEDLASHASFDGLFFDGNAGGDLPEGTGSVAFTQQLVARASAFRAPLLVARSLSVGSAMTPEEVRRLNETLRDYIFAYDQVVLTAASTAADVSAALSSLVAQRKTLEVGRGKLVFMLPHRHGLSGRDHSGKILAEQMRTLQLGGAFSFAYFPDDFQRDDPPLAQIAPVMSLRVFMQQTGH